MKIFNIWSGQQGIQSDIQYSMHVMYQERDQIVLCHPPPETVPEIQTALFLEFNLLLGHRVVGQRDKKHQIVDGRLTGLQRVTTLKLVLSMCYYTGVTSFVPFLQLVSEILTSILSMLLICFFGLFLEPLFVLPESAIMIMNLGL